MLAKYCLSAKHFLLLLPFLCKYFVTMHLKKYKSNKNVYFSTCVGIERLAGPRTSTTGGLGLSTANKQDLPTEILSSASGAIILAAGATLHLNGLPGTSCPLNRKSTECGVASLGVNEIAYV